LSAQLGKPVIPNPAPSYVKRSRGEDLLFGFRQGLIVDVRRASFKSQVRVLFLRVEAQRTGIAPRYFLFRLLPAPPAPARTAAPPRRLPKSTGKYWEGDKASDYGIAIVYLIVRFPRGRNLRVSPDIP